MQLDDLAPRSATLLSGGQQQRVALARAIAVSSRLLLMDEPLSNLDAKLRVQMRAEIARIQQTLKVTTLYVTHDQVEAMTLASRMIVMNAGRAEQIGAPLELYDRPGNLFVAQFIGSPAMNTVQGVLRLQGGEQWVEALGQRWPAPAGSAGTDGMAVHYGVRPSDIGPSNSGAGVPA